jgi:ankyrin repeat protein
MAFAWLGTALAFLLAVAVVLWGCLQWQRRHEAARIVRAIQAEDHGELLLLLVEGSDFRSVRDWFGEPALILAVRSAGCETVGILISHGADINEPGTEWKTALMHAAADGELDVCAVLLSHGADAAAHDMFGRTAADWARSGGHHRIASMLRKVEA